MRLRGNISANKRISRTSENFFILSRKPQKTKILNYVKSLGTRLLNATELIEIAKWPKIPSSYSLKLSELKQYRIDVSFIVLSLYLWF